MAQWWPRTSRTWPAARASPSTWPLTTAAPPVYLARWEIGPTEVMETARAGVRDTRSWRVCLAESRCVPARAGRAQGDGGNADKCVIYA